MLENNCCNFQRAADTGHVKPGAIAVAIVFCLQTLSSAQFPVWRVSGRIVDQQRLPLPGVTVTAAFGDQQRQGVTNIDGRYELENILSGNYVLTAELTGFRTVRRTIRAKTAGSAIVDLTMRLRDCVVVVNASGFQGPPSPPPFVSAQVSARSDIVADLVIVGHPDDSASSDCRRSYTAWVLRALSRQGFRRTVVGRINLLLNTSVEPGREYVIWLTWRSNKSAFESGELLEGVLQRVEDGEVRTRGGTYSIDELFKIFEDIWVR